MPTYAMFLGRGYLAKKHMKLYIEMIGGPVVLPRILPHNPLSQLLPDTLILLQSKFGREGDGIVWVLTDFWAKIVVALNIVETGTALTKASRSWPRSVQSW